MFRYLLFASITILIAVLLGKIVSIFINNNKELSYREQLNTSLVSELNLEIGEELPDLTLTDLHLKSVKLSEILANKRFVFFLDPNCYACFEEIQNIIEIDKRALESILFISSANPSDLLELTNLIESNRNIYYDHQQFYIDKLGIRAFPFHIKLSKDLKIEEIYPSRLTKEELSYFLNYR